MYHLLKKKKSYVNVKMAIGLQKRTLKRENIAILAFHLLEITAIHP